MKLETLKIEMLFKFLGELKYFFHSAEAQEINKFFNPDFLSIEHKKKWENVQAINKKFCFKIFGCDFYSILDHESFYQYGAVQDNNDF